MIAANKFDWSKDHRGVHTGVAEISDLQLPGFPGLLEVKGLKGTLSFIQKKKDFTPDGELAGVRYEAYGDGGIRLLIIND